MSKSAHANSYSRPSTGLTSSSEPTPTGFTRLFTRIFANSGYLDVFDDSFFRQLDLRYGRHYAFRRDYIGCSTVIELHWRLVQHSSQDQDAVTDLWAEAQPTLCF